MKNKMSLPLIPQEVVKSVDIDMVPGLRDRLLAELAMTGTAGTHRTHRLSELSGRAPQTVARWIDSDKPGLPDLKSVAILCLQFGVDANWILGLTENRTPFPMENLNAKIRPQVLPGSAVRINWIGHILAQVDRSDSFSQVAIMRGDDMAPLICEGAVFFVDSAVTLIDANGVYLLEYEGKTLVRHVELRIGEGLLLRCENERYGSTTIKDLDAAARIGLKVLGKVSMALNAVRL